MNRKEFLYLMAGGSAYFTLMWLLSSCKLKPPSENASSQQDEGQERLDQEELLKITMDRPGFAMLAASAPALMEFDLAGKITRLSSIGQQFVKDQLVAKGLQLRQVGLTTPVEVAFSGVTIDTSKYFTLAHFDTATSTVYSSADGRSFIKFFKPYPPEGSYHIANKEYQIFKTLFLQQVPELVDQFENVAQLVSSVDDTGLRYYGVQYYGGMGIQSVPLNLAAQILNANQNSLVLEAVSRAAAVSALQTSQTFIPELNGYPTLYDLNASNILVFQHPLQYGQLLVMPIDYLAWEVAPRALPLPLAYETYIRVGYWTKDLPSHLVKQLERSILQSFATESAAVFRQSTQFAKALQQTELLQQVTSGLTHTQQSLVIVPENLSPVLTRVAPYYTPVVEGTNLIIRMDQMLTKQGEVLRIQELTALETTGIPLRRYTHIYLEDALGQRVEMIIDMATIPNTVGNSTLITYRLVEAAKRVGKTFLSVINPAFMLLMANDMVESVKSIAIPKYWQEFSFQQAKIGERTQSVQLHSLFNRLLEHKQESLKGSNVSMLDQLRDVVTQDPVLFDSIGLKFNLEEYLNWVRTLVAKHDAVVGSLPLEFVKSGETYTSNARIVATAPADEQGNPVPTITVWVQHFEKEQPPEVVGVYKLDMIANVWSFESMNGGTVSVIPTQGDAASDKSAATEYSGEYRLELAGDSMSLFHFYSQQY